jgi:hypothetical protein
VLQELVGWLFGAVACRSSSVELVSTWLAALPVASEVSRTWSRLLVTSSALRAARSIERARSCPATDCWSTAGAGIDATPAEPTWRDHYLGRGPMPEE